LYHSEIIQTALVKQITSSIRKYRQIWVTYFRTEGVQLLMLAKLVCSTHVI
jgi:LPS sulfotransferase NodH